MRFNFRGFTSLLLTVSFMIISLTGIVLYIVPAGRVANWTNWMLFGLTKTQWSSLHTLFSFLFIIIAVIHITYNWRVLLAYLKDRATKAYRLKAELALALVISLVVGIGSIAALPPFGTVMSVGETIKESWEVNADTAPAPHTEIRILEEVTLELGMQPDRMLMKLEQNGITGATLDMTLLDIATENDISPSELYRIMQQRGGGVEY